MSVKTGRFENPEAAEEWLNLAAAEGFRLESVDAAGQYILIILRNESAASLEEHRRRWRWLYREEEKRLSAALAGQVVVIQHVSSTAIPGLNLAPAMDIALGLDKLSSERVEDLAVTLGGLGYRIMPEVVIPGEVLFQKGSGLCHLHVLEYNSPFWQNYLLFRDYLRGNPREARKYEESKRDLAARYQNQRSAYVEAKADLITGILERAREDEEKPTRREGQRQVPGPAHVEEAPAFYWQLSTEARQAVEAAQGAAAQTGNVEFMPYYLLQEILRENDSAAARAMQAVGLDPLLPRSELDAGRSKAPQELGDTHRLEINPQLAEILYWAEYSARKAGLHLINTDHLLLAVLHTEKENETAVSLFSKLGWDLQVVYQDLNWLLWGEDRGGEGSGEDG